MKDVRLVFHCAECLKTMPVGMSPTKYARQQSYLTTTGEIAVWCNRHDTMIGVVTQGGKVPQLLLDAKCSCCPGGTHDNSKKNP